MPKAGVVGIGLAAREAPVDLHVVLQAEGERAAPRVVRAVGAVGHEDPVPGDGDAEGRLQAVGALEGVGPGGPVVGAGGQVGVHVDGLGRRRPRGRGQGRGGRRGGRRAGSGACSGASGEWDLRSGRGLAQGAAASHCNRHGPLRGRSGADCLAVSRSRSNPRRRPGAGAGPDAILTPDVPLPRRPARSTMRALLAAGLVLLGAGCGEHCRPRGEAKPGFTVAAASSLAGVVEDLVAGWVAAGEPAPRLTIGPSSTLARQLECGSALLDLLLSADERWLDELAANGWTATRGWTSRWAGSWWRTARGSLVVAPRRPLPRKTARGSPRAVDRGGPGPCPSASTHGRPSSRAALGRACRAG